MNAREQVLAHPGLWDVQPRAEPVFAGAVEGIWHVVFEDSNSQGRRIAFGDTEEQAWENAWERIRTRDWIR